MSKNCSQDGGFIGKSGCTHPNHNHSELVKGLIAKAKKPCLISSREADAALREGFYVNSAYTTRVGFGEKLIIHIGHHNKADQNRRKTHLLYAIATVKSGKRGPNPKGGPGSYAYAKNIDGKKFLVLTDKEGQVEEVFNIIPRGGK
jgi:hypothetical protein